MKKLIFTLVAFTSFVAFAQENKEEPKFGIKFSGFVKTDIFYDTRQTVNSREGHFMLYPDKVLKDAYNQDFNDKSSFNILSIQSRLKGTITGPDAFGAKTSGVVEADFFGNSGAGLDDVNGFRLRHAFVKMNWTSTELLVGQFWHPMFATDCFPGVISFNTGAPFNPFSRNPQIRLTHKVGSFSLTGTLFTQRDFQSTGPDGSSSKYVRNAGIPNANLQLQLKFGTAGNLFGAGVDVKSLVPRISNTVTVGTVSSLYEVDEKLTSLSTFAYTKLNFKPFSLKLYGIYAQNATDLTMIGGYAASKIANTTTGELEYTNLTTASIWSELQTNGKEVQFGIFGGYTKQLGSSDVITGAIYARNANIDQVVRIAPRVVFISGKLNIAVEGEYTSAQYGNANGDTQGGVTNAEGVNNMRGLLSFIYNF